MKGTFEVDVKEAEKVKEPAGSKGQVERLTEVWSSGPRLKEGGICRIHS